MSDSDVTALARALHELEESHKASADRLELQAAELVYLRDQVVALEREIEGLKALRPWYAQGGLGTPDA